MKVSGQVI